MATMHRPTYQTWHNMLRRCRNSACASFEHYGGRGITVCKRWQKFANFLADMGERPKGMTIDRINNEGHYEPGNCRWATKSENAKNQRPRKPYRTKPRGMEPAASIVYKLGGAAKIADLLELDRASVYYWLRPRKAPGTGGNIPYWYHEALLAHAREQGIKLRPADFVSRLTRE